MKRPQLTRTWAAVIGTAAVLVMLFVFSPLTLGSGGRACGPDAFDLYRFMSDDITYWHGPFSREVFSMRDPCRRHDRCYTHSGIDRATCDTRFLTEMQTVCDAGLTAGSRRTCSLYTTTFFGLVRGFGWLAFHPPHD